MIKASIMLLQLITLHSSSKLSGLEHVMIMILNDFFFNSYYFPKCLIALTTNQLFIKGRSLRLGLNFSNLKYIMSIVA